MIVMSPGAGWPVVCCITWALCPGATKGSTSHHNDQSSQLTKPLTVVERIDAMLAFLVATPRVQLLAIQETASGIREAVTNPRLFV
jgi:hypothetical protein